MKILVLASYIPSYYKGAEIRLLQLLRHLAPKHEITLWAINRRDVSDENVAERVPGVRLMLQNMGEFPRNPISVRLRKMAWYRQFANRYGNMLSPLPTAIGRIYHPTLKKRLADLLVSEQFDLIHVNQIMVAHYLTDMKPNAPVLLAKDNAWAALAEREVAAERQYMTRMLKQNEAAKMLKYERRVVEMADHSAVVSAEDAIEIEKFTNGQRPPSIVPNGVDTEQFTPTKSRSSQPRLVFVGAMGWQPNQDAVIWFCNEILPLVSAEFSKTLMSVVGMHPPREVQRLNKIPHVNVTGFVPDVRPYVEDAHVYVVPLRVGSGTRLKVLEALAVGKAVVSTTIGAEGLDVEHDKHLLIADDVQSFADAVTQLLSDPARRARLGEAGRKLVEEKYDWSVIAEKMDEVYQEVAGD